jgi:hypothetical protein
MKLLLLTLSFFILSCASKPIASVPQEANTKYYFGEVLISSPDGKTAYGKSVSLIKRVVDPSQQTISEIVLQPSRDPKQKPKDINTTLKRAGNSNTFLATDDEKKFEGKLTFTGDEWSWNNWTYDIKLADGSKLTGIGVMDLAGIKTEKTFFKPDGKASILIKEDVRVINSEEYAAKHKQIMGN